MSRELRYAISIVVGLITLALLIWLTVAAPPDPAHLLLGPLFCALIVFTTVFGVPLGGGSVSLLPMTTVAAYLVMGPVPTLWAAFVGALAYGAIRHRWAKQLEVPPAPGRMGLIGLIAANVTMHSASILAGDAVFRSLGGPTPLAAVAPPALPPLVFLCLAYLSVNYLIAGAFIAMRGRAQLQLYLRSLPNLVLYEGGPLIFAPLTALIYTQLGMGLFIAFTLAIVVSSLAARDLALARRRLERRVQELDSLHAVGQALSASLDLDTILSAIHTQVAKLMPADNFYVALCDPEADEVSFPLAIEDRQRAHWRSRQMGRGLTEHILRTRAPLLIPKDISAWMKELGVEEIGRLAASWLGVPILAGDEPLGIIAVQSYSAPDVYDVSHREMLVTLAAHAAVAIQNARLYTRTDEALARRVQELDSILRTTSEGILLFDPNWRVLAANRALAEFLGVAQLELAGQVLDTPWQDEVESLLSLIEYTPAKLQTDCEALTQDAYIFKKQEIVIPGPPERYVERTLTPVRDRKGTITGWLLILRDLTEERELALLREELTHMLIHDLRSPLTVVQGSLDIIERNLAAGTMEDIDQLLVLARKSSNRISRMVDELLDVSRLESGQMPLHLEAVDVKTLLEDSAARFAPLAVSAHVSLEISAEPDLSPLHVDPELTGRVLNNLLDNAIKFTPDGGRIRLWARLEPERTPDALLIGVSDTGPGIPPEALSRLFKKFQQVTSIRGRRTGTSLGLPFCKLAVEAHGGRIWVETEVGRGSTFTVVLPTTK